MENYSVLMSVYIKDNPNYFRNAIESMMEQTVKTNDFVIVCDGPLTEKLDNVIADFVDEYPEIFNVIRLQVNSGLGIALNEGLQVCKNELIARMDADDISVSKRIEWQLNAFRQYPEMSIIGGQIAEFEGAMENVVGYRYVPIEFSGIKKYSRNRNPMNHVTVMMKKSHVLKAGNYLHMDRHEDYYLWMRMMLHDMKFLNLEKILVNVRVGKDMYQRRGGWEYFVSGARFQRFLLENKIVTTGTYIINITKRFVVQIMLPNSMRGLVFKTFARKRKI